MSEMNSVEIRIHGKEYKIKGLEKEEYMQKVAYYIDKKMADISKNSVRMDSGSIAALTLINITDDYFKLQDSFAAIRQDIQNKTGELEKCEAELNVNKVKLTKTKLELEKVKEELAQLKKKK